MTKSTVIFCWDGSTIDALALDGWYSDAVLQWLESKFWLNPWTWAQEKQLKKYAISSKALADALKINHLSPMTPTSGSAPGSPLGPLIGSRARHVCIIKNSLK